MILDAIPQVGFSVGSIFNIAPRIPFLGNIIDILLAVVTGIVALAGIGQISNPAWSIILIVLGFFAGGLGGIIVILAAIIALVADFV